MAETNNKSAKRGIGRRFVPSKSGNRPTLTLAEIEMRNAARLNGPEALQTILTMMRESSIDSVRLKAAEIILDRGFGKAPLVVEVDDNRTARELSEAELMVIASGALERLH